MDTKEKSSRKSPEETTNILNSLVFGWLLPIFWKGAKRNLNVTDLYDPLKCDESERLGNLLEREWNKELLKADEELLLGKDGKKKAKNQPNLIWAIIRVFWVKYTFLGILVFIQIVVFRTMQPILQGLIIDYFDPNETSITRNEVLGYIGALISANILSVILNHHCNLRIQQIGMQIRIACCSIIYRKVLRIDQAALNHSAAGRVANLVSNDVSRFDFVPMFLHYIWIMPIHIVYIGYLMWQSVGVAALVGIGAIIIQSIPIQGYLSNINGRLRSKIANKTDERVQLMSELISGIQVVKMYSWEKPFELIVSKIRAMEVKLIGQTSYLRAFYLSIMVFCERLTLYLILVTFVLTGNTLTAEVTFVLASLLNVLQSTCAIFFPQAVIMASETVVSVRRLTEFLLLNEVKCSEKTKPTANGGIQCAEISTSQQSEQRIEIEMVNVAANWVHGHLPPTLCEVSINVKCDSLSVLVGPVGSGKSSLLHIMLGELPVGAGSMSIFTSENGSRNQINRKDIRISYSSQDPWLFSGSVRDNILFGQPYDKQRYQEVTRVCALMKDFEQLPDGDMSFVGERGMSLSGGQRARVNLARAVYRDADLYLFDDPLSAVDARVSRHLFDECIKGFLKGKTRILVTHQLQYLQQADTIIVLNRGTVVRQATYEELNRSNLHILDTVVIDEPDEAEHTADSNEENTECKTKTVTASDRDQVSEIPDNNEGYKDVSEEEMATGDISKKVYWGYFKAGGNLCWLTCCAIIFLLGQILSSGTDYWTTFWTNQEAVRMRLQSNDFSSNDTVYRNASVNEREEKYSASESLWFDEYGLILPNVAIYIYTVCILACIFFVILRSMLYMKICMNASRNIHNSMFANLLRATMRFFNTNPSGRILNRFSKDMGTMDETLPKVMLESLQIFGVMIGILAMVIIVNNYMIIPTIVMCCIFYMIRIYYIKTAQDVKRLEGITKSPVFSHISSTLDGLTTIRSTGPLVEGLLRKEFDCYQDTHTGAWYLSIATASAFGLILDFVSCAFIACVCFSFIFINDGTILGGSVGLAISQSLILTGMVQYGVRQSTEVISQMTSVERVLQYTNLPKEGSLTTRNPPPPTWPSKGALVFKNVYMRYSSDKPPVLKGLNMNIQSGWKIGIVGRTGAGKTSLISALFRLTEDGLEGEILLDGINTKSVGLHELRPRISIIPQEPILFSASLRYNLDPFEQYSDEDLWNSLREVELGDSVSSLDTFVAGGGANFSVGQRQLICLARAILRNNRILVLDEATANVDHNTDALIQSTIRRRFADCTVLTIAHRLNTVMDSDRVLVMEGGSIVEFGHPHLLLENPNGHFSQMLQQTGRGMTEKLSEIAKAAHLMNPEFHQELNDSSLIFNSNQMTYL